eukprot:scaffold50278_cov52-Attheya_sp.AAC.3
MKAVVRDYRNVTASENCEWTPVGSVVLSEQRKLLSLLCWKMKRIRGEMRRTISLWMVCGYCLECVRRAPLEHNIILKPNYDINMDSPPNAMNERNNDANTSFPLILAKSSDMSRACGPAKVNSIHQRHHLRNRPDSCQLESTKASTCVLILRQQGEVRLR